MEITKVNIRQYRSDPIEVVEAKGEIDIINIDSFKQPLLAAADLSGDLVIDMREVYYIDSAGLEVLINVYTKRARNNKPFAILVKKGSQPDEVLHIVHFHTLTRITSDPSEVGLEI